MRVFTRGYGILAILQFVTGCIGMFTKGMDSALECIEQFNLWLINDTKGNVLVTAQVIFVLISCLFVSTIFYRTPSKFKLFSK